MNKIYLAGIMLLEKQLLQKEDDGQSRRKRARTSAAPPSEVTTSWIELSKWVSRVLRICWLLYLLTCVVMFYF